MGGAPATAATSAGGALVAKIVFLATGVWWGIGVQLMVYAGIAADPSALLPNFTWYASMMLGLLLSERFLKVRCCDGGGAEPHGCSVAVGCLADEGVRGPPSGRWAWWRLPPLRGMVSSRDIVLASWCDYLGTVATAMGLTLAGSGIFGLIYSSVSCWAALEWDSSSADWHTEVRTKRSMGPSRAADARGSSCSASL